MTHKKLRPILFAALALFGLLKPAHAWIFEQIPDKAVTVHYKLTVAAITTTNTVIVDLSDTTNWPHKETGEINIDAIKVDFDKVAASSATLKLGVVNYIDSSTGSITWVWSREMSKNVSNTNNSVNQNNMPTFLKCRVNPTAPTGVLQADGATPYILSSDTTSGSTTYQNDVFLPNARGSNSGPGLGDIILQVVNNDATNSIIVIVDLTYHSNSR